MANEVSKPVVKIMENLIATVELAEQAPDFVANSFQTAFDDYADDKLEEAAALLDQTDGKAAALVRMRDDPPNIASRAVQRQSKAAHAKSVANGCLVKESDSWEEF